MSDDSDRTVTLKLPKNPFKRNRSGDGNGDKKHKRHVLLWFVVIYLVIKDLVDTMTINSTIEGIVEATKLDRSIFKDVDYTADYILNPFSLFGGLLGDISLTNALIVALIVACAFLARAAMKNNKKDEDHS